MNQKSHLKCPMDALLHLIMGPWTTYLLWTLSQNGPLRFGVLKRRLPGISSRVLTQRLRMLETAGVIFRDHRATIPPQVTYGLTQRGVELGGVLNDLEVIARRWDMVSETENIPVTQGDTGH